MVTAPQPLVAPPTQIQNLEAELCGLLLERDDVVRAALVALVAQQHLVLIGKPGTAKSYLVELLGERIAPASGGGLQTFVWLLTRFTTPEELFGPISVKGLKNDEYRRITTQKLPEAELAFLDEIFKANSAVLNALLTILNERRFDNGTHRLHVPLMSLFGASNELPQGDDLQALWDRFALRLIVEYVSDTGFPKLLQLAAQATPPTILPQADLYALQQQAATLPIPPGIFDTIVQLRKHLAGKGIEASDRRWRQMLPLLRAHALIEGRTAVEEDDVMIVREALWTTPDERQEIGRVVSKLANPLNGKAVELGDQAASVYESAMQAQRTAPSDEAKMQAAVEANTKLKSIATQVSRLLEQATAQGRSTARIERVMTQVKQQRADIAELVLN